MKIKTHARDKRMGFIVEAIDEIGEERNEMTSKIEVDCGNYAITITFRKIIMNDNSYLRNVAKERQQRLIIFFFLNYLSAEIPFDRIGYNYTRFSFFQTIGNHEFDNNVEGVVPFLKMIKAPVVVTNIDATEEPTMQVDRLISFFEKFLRRAELGIDRNWKSNQQLKTKVTLND